MNALPHHPAPDPADLRWAALAEAETLGQPLAPDDLQFLRMHVPSDPTLRAEHALRWALGGWGEGPTYGEDDEAVIAAAVSAHVHGVGERKGRRVAWIAGAAGLAAAAAVVLAVLARPGETVTPEVAGIENVAARGGSEDEGARSEGNEARVPEEARGAAGEPGSGGALRSLSGTWVDEGGLALAGAPAPGTVLTATSEACLGDAAGGRLCVRPGARVRAVAADRPAVEWLEGSGELTLPEAPASEAGAAEGPVPQASVIELRVAGVAVTGAAASIAVESTLEGRWTLVVREGEVELRTAEGTRSLVAGDRWSPDESLVENGGGSSRAATPDAATLLRRARAARASGEMAEAASLYRRLLDVYPRSTSAGPAWVALGQVELSRGRARAALDAFDRYLDRGGGPLAEEAAYGRIEALRKLGRAKEEQAAIERFLAKYPGSSYAAKLQRRP
jgi:TolA-binding protein